MFLATQQLSGEFQFLDGLTGTGSNPGRINNCLVVSILISFAINWPIQSKEVHVNV